MFKLFSWFNKKINKSPDLRFVDTTNLFFNKFPILPAKKASKLLKEKQTKVNGEYSLTHCPGMIEYTQMGYVVTTFTDLYIKANKAGTFCSVGGRYVQNVRQNIPSKTETLNYIDNVTNSTLSHAKEVLGEDNNIIPKIQSITTCKFNTMDETLVRGIAERYDDIPENTWKLSLPYKVVGTNKNISGLIMPPFYHNPELLKNLYIYPGNVDFGRGFATINFVFTIIKKCEFVIPAGTPILHVIPIAHNEEVKATYGGTNYSVTNLLETSNLMHQLSFYKRFCSIPKKYSLNEHNPENITKELANKLHENDLR